MALTRSGTLSTLVGAAFALVLAVVVRLQPQPVPGGLDSPLPEPDAEPAV